MFTFPQTRSQDGRAILRPGRFAAFTLIELVIVTVIVAIVGSIALPRYAKAVAHYRLNSALNRVVADITAARSLAMATSKKQTVTFNAGGNSYTVSGLVSLENNGSIYTANLSAEPYKTDITLVSFGFFQQTISFDAYGTPDNAGVLFLACGGVSKSIHVDGNTGKASIP